MNLFIHQLVIPFTTGFKHNTAERHQTQAVIVEAKSDNLVGLGEGCPRFYVTGESIKSVLLFFSLYKVQCEQLTSLDKVKEWQIQNKVLIDKNPSAWCAIECAILDLLSQQSKQNIESFLGIDSVQNNFEYTAVIGSENIDKFYQVINFYKHTKFKKYKIKLSGNLELDKEKIKHLKLLNVSHIRLDGNNIWNSHTQAVNYLRFLDHNFYAIEEPVSPYDFNSMNKIINALNTPIIVDESFLTIDDFNNINSSYIINIRISKMGGILRSLEILKEAYQRNIAVILGAQVGETSILTRAALVIANHSPNSIIAHEGAFGTHLLKYDITTTPLMFDANALVTPNYSSYGLGVYKDCIQ